MKCKVTQRALWRRRRGSSELEWLNVIKLSVTVDTIGGWNIVSTHTQREGDMQNKRKGRRRGIESEFTNLFDGTNFMLNRRIKFRFFGRDVTSFNGQCIRVDHPRLSV